MTAMMAAGLGQSRGAWGSIRISQMGGKDLNNCHHPHLYSRTYQQRAQLEVEH